MAKRGYLFGVIPFGPRFGNYLAKSDFRRPWRWLVAIRSTHIDGHAAGCAVFSPASYHRSSPIPCTCGFERENEQ